MAPVRINDGLWTNVEDEILKAAISKYGLNQWSRVSSLLTRKNAKQCKLRWQEWLDPRIKKHDWSVEEDKQLLNLTNLRPNQWGSISLTMNRTANQCIERYQELLTDHTSLENLLDPNDKTAATKLLLTGNVENSGLNKSISQLGGTSINHESKPSRPDNEELDEDEQEMIMEAKARLANTQGKKAKRKAREKILNESKHVADLLRRRELKQVGIDAKMKMKKTYKHQMDYNADIAFERRPEEGRFDTSDEKQRNFQQRQVYDKNTEQKGTFNQEVEALKRKEKKRKNDNKMFDRSQENKVKRSFEDMNDDEKYADEFIKRRKFTFSNDTPTTDIDQLLDNTVQTIKDKNTGKSLVFSRKYTDEDSGEVASPIEARIKEKEAKKLKKEQKKRLIGLLESLPEAEDDFDIEMSEAVSDQPLISIKVNKPNGETMVIDKTVLRRKEREKLTELKNQLQELQIPHSIKRQLPIINTFGKENKNNDEIDRMMLDLTQGRTNHFMSDDINDLQKTLSIWNQIETEVDAAITKDVDYDSLIESTDCKLNRDTHLQLIRFYTEKSMELEKNTKSQFDNKRAELSIDNQIKEMKQYSTDINTTEAELWVYDQFTRLEADAISTRKERIQRELDTVNTLIENAKFS